MPEEDAQWITLHAARHHPQVQHLRLSWAGLLELVKQGAITAKTTMAPSTGGTRARNRLRQMILLPTLLQWAEGKTEEAAKEDLAVIWPKTPPRKLTEDQVELAAIRRRMDDHLEKEWLREQLTETWDRCPCHRPRPATDRDPRPATAALAAPATGGRPRAVTQSTGEKE